MARCGFSDVQEWEPRVRYLSLRALGLGFTNLRDVLAKESNATCQGASVIACDPHVE